MIALKNKKSKKWVFLFLGLICGALLTVGIGMLAYQHVTGENALSKLHYVLDRGKEYIVSFSRKKIRNISTLCISHPLLCHVTCVLCHCFL